ncbi:hypothetical protein E4U55_008168 [Claviceps digitariae]|nr:hypothetical protein E4U55_008168 [Claviceps digitariae]
MVSILSLRGLFGKQTSLPSTTTTTTHKLLFSTSTTAMARMAPNPAPGIKPVRKGRAVQKSENFERIKTLRQNMFSRAPPPLRMARLRHLRHWTIHRAWQLFRRQQHEAIAKERQRMHAGMFNACEELRKTVGPEGRGEGYLYRVAMELKGVWGTKAIPIEYARLQTEYPGKEPWKHDWKR